MAKSFDVSKFRKDLTKSITGMSSGFNDPTFSNTGLPLIGCARIWESVFKRLMKRAQASL